ncbi:hypothetical protein ABEB36_012509 [Hypothenemus hampei]|uniref:Lamin-B receptor n=1 Tax=Hypothenemus hampei TaxID=57062 RepID=A0ABD1EBL1_HYPHA
MVYEKKTKNSELGRTMKSTSPGRSPGRKKNLSQTESPKKTESPKRTKSPARTKSPSRKKSPSRMKLLDSDDGPKRRSSDRTKSPTRLATKPGHLTPTRRSPIRSSPSRLAKEKSDKNKDSAIPLLKKKVIEIETDSDGADDKIEIKEKPKAAVRGRTRADLTDKVEKKGSSVESVASKLVKRITRSQQKEVERIVHLKHFDTVSKKLSEFSDEDEFVKESSVLRSDKSVFDLSIIGIPILLTALPALGFYLYTFCNEISCKFNQPLSDFLKLSSYFSVKIAIGYFSYLVYIAIISALPFGGRKIPGLPDKQGKFIYVANGLFGAILALGLVISLEYWNISILTAILKNQLQLYVLVFLTGLLLSCYAYLRSYYVSVSALNPSIINKNKLYNFVMGREIHPRLFRTIDWKFFVYKFQLITELLIIVAYLYKSCQNIGCVENEEIGKVLLKLSPTLLTYSFLKCTQIFDSLIFEHARLTSKETQQEGFGYNFSVNNLISPLITSFLIRFIVEHNVQLAWWKLGIITFFYLTGRLIARISNNLKDAFRKNPYSPSLSKLEAIPTNQGKKILASGLWSRVRHPNYLGDIISELALIPFVACSPPVLIQIFRVLFLLNRAHRDNQHCKQKYGPTWDRYCNRVPYLLIPRVY